MHPHFIRVKICCIKSVEEAKMAIQAGASVLGLVGNMPSGPGVISDDKINEIIREVPSYVDTFLLTSETSSKGIIEHHQRVKTSHIQIVDELREGSYAEIRQALPEVGLVQVVHVIDESTLIYASKVAKEVDYLLLDSGNPNLKVKELGGTGRTHNWEISKKIVEETAIPVFLAGGIKSTNVEEAFQKVLPYGLDLCSGVRTNDTLDAEKLNAFFQSVKGINPTAGPKKFSNFGRR